MRFGKFEIDVIELVILVLALLGALGIISEAAIKIFACSCGG